MVAVLYAVFGVFSVLVEFREVVLVVGEGLDFCEFGVHLYNILGTILNPHLLMTIVASLPESNLHIADVFGNATDILLLLQPIPSLLKYIPQPLVLLAVHSDALLATAVD